MRQLNLIKKVIFVGVVVSTILQAQSGESAVPFLLITPNSRSAAMGETGTAIADNASNSFWNPAVLAYMRSSEASITHANWLPQLHLNDMTYDYVSGYKYIPDWQGTISGSLTYLNLGEFVGYNEQDEELGKFPSSEFAITLGYGFQANDDIGLGLTMRYIKSSLTTFGAAQERGAGESSGLSFDLGVLYKPTAETSNSSLLNRFSCGLSLSNIGAPMTYIDAAQADPLPFNLRLGLAFVPLKNKNHQITLACDIRRMLVDRDTDGSAMPFYSTLFTSWSNDNLFRSLQSSLGAEYWYDKTVALRIGYLYEDPMYGNRNYVTYGGGVRYNIYGIDFSYISAGDANSPLAGTLRFTLLVSWDSVN